MNEHNTGKKVLLSALALVLLGGSAQVGAVTFQVASLTRVYSDPTGPAAPEAAKAEPAILAFARSVQAGPPISTLLVEDRNDVVKVLKDAGFAVLADNYGLSTDTEGFYSEKMDCTLLLSRHGQLWLIAMRGLPGTELYSPSQTVYGPF